jgi:predicted metal-dependent hydrolase
MLHFLRFLWTDGKLFSRQTWRDFARVVTLTTANNRFRRDYLAYYRRDFHPWQLDNRHLLEEFEADLATSQYYAAAR